jgi:hypothetical protein
VSAEQESARIRKEGEDYERRKKALENPFGFGSVGEIPFEIQLVGLGLLMFFFFMAMAVIL